MKVANPANYPVASFKPAGTPAAPQPQEAAPDTVSVGRAMRRLNDPVLNTFRAGLLAAGGAELASQGGLGIAGGIFGGGAAGAIAGYHIGRSVANRATEESSDLAKNARGIGAAVGAGVGIALAFTGNPVLAGCSAAVAAACGSVAANR